MAISFEGINLKCLQKVRICYENGDCIEKKLIVCNSFLKRLKGMLFERKPVRENAYLIIPCNSIHTFFMAYPIDVIFLEKSGDVLSFFRVNPFKVKGERDAFAVLEGIDLINGDNKVVAIDFLC